MVWCLYRYLVHGLKYVCAGSMEDLDSDSDCASSDSGLETGNSNMETLETLETLDMGPDSFLG
jgi:hypothetical protein